MDPILLMDIGESNERMLSRKEDDSSGDEVEFAFGDELDLT